MRRIYGWTPEVSQAVANQGVRLIESHLKRFGVERAWDMPEEGRIRLLRDLQAFFRAVKTDNDYEIQRTLYQLKLISRKRWLLIRICRFLFGE